MVLRAMAYQRKLQEAGVDPKVAQAHAEALEDLVASNIVTNDHLDAKLAQMDAHFDKRFAEVEAKLVQHDMKFAQIEARMGELKADLRSEIRAAEATLIRWMVGTVGVALGLSLAFLRFVR